MLDVESRREIAADVPTPVAETWRSLTDPEVVSGWLGTLAPGFDPGATAQLDFGDGEFLLVDTIRVEAPRLLEFEYRLMGFGTPQSIAWRVQPTAIGSRVTVSALRDASEAEVQGWRDFLGRLASFLSH
jgi:uncharacterized protein YndB with AHSA1/START domain